MSLLLILEKATKVQTEKRIAEAIAAQKEKNAFVREAFRKAEEIVSEKQAEEQARKEAVRESKRDRRGKDV
jgi:hypothetical protein